ncbi:transport and Golgi organization protein 1 homolog [Pteropus vampyrus]|uniref:Transport and Golgi organization protein 1 homolog n=1 Tax=Pteropus vampyrus TaxID=132908 RepID=A0A6P6BLD5_PTEVA|nr:transport and Golgi organization protein 1 homolog [Pteropus vampyrus]
MNSQKSRVSLNPVLMYRGEALEDFTGPDCRFVNFKKGDHVYVYYKLAGGAPEVWAGTVGRNFGYFPKDFIRVAHEYIEEELKVPADETDFVCFDGGKDDFDNYNIEELLGFLKLPESATGDSGKTIEKTSQHVENPEVSEESALDPAEANTEESESELSENTEELEERHASRKNPPHVNRQTDDPQGESSFDHFEEMLQEKLKVPESQNNKTSNSSQVANEQEQIDAYKLLKKEMTLDLKTKFGSTADALVSDDETTSLVTSLEDDFDEDLDDEYYIVGKEEEDQESFDELPLLTFTDEDLETPLESGAEKHSPDKEQNSSEEDKAEVTQPPGVRHDATVTESEQMSVDLENSSSEAEGSDDAFVPDGEWGEPQLAADYVESEKAEDGLLIVHGLETNEDKDPEVDAELGSKGKGRTGEGSPTDLPRSKKGPEDGKQEGGTPRGSAQSRDLDSLPAPGKERAALTSTFGNKEGDLKGTVVSVSKETLHEEKPGEQLLEGGSDSGSERMGSVSELCQPSAFFPVEVQPPLEENFPLENTDDLQMQNPEGFGPLDQPTTGDMNVSDASEKPNTEEAVDPGIVTTDSSPVDAADGKKQRVTNADEPASVTPLENAILLIYSSMYYLTKTLVATLPDDVQPGPDFYGLPWKPVLITAFLGIVSFVIFFWRTILVVKNRVYQVTEQQISEKLKNITKENAELVQKLSDYEQKIKESKKHVQETKKQNMILSDEAIKFKDKIRKLEETNESLNDTAKSLRVMLDSERDQNAKNQDLILENKKSLEKLKDVIAMNSSELSEVQIALNEAKLSEEKVKSECHRVQEENTRLKKKKEQLQQEIKDWSKSHAELSEQIRSFETCQKDLEVALTHKDDSVNALTNCITQLNRLDCESESEGQNKGGNESDELANGEVGGKISFREWVHCRCVSADRGAEHVTELVETSVAVGAVGQQWARGTSAWGVHAACGRSRRFHLTDFYRRKLSQEEYERQEREQRLSAADEKAVLAAEEVKTYKRRIEEMEDELQKTERAFKSQIATHEKKAHDNWLKARAAERAIAEEKREAANLRHKLLELTQKMAMLQEEPVIVKPMPGRPSAQNPPRRGPLSQNGSFGPSPVSGGECSPPPDPPVRPPSATLGRGDVPRRDLGSADGSLPRPRWSSEASGKPSASEPASGATPMTNSSSRSSSPSKVMDEGKQTALHEPEGPSVPSIPSLAEHPVAVNVAAKGPPPFPGVPLLSSPVGGPLLPPIRYGPPPQLCGPFGPRPLPPPFGPGFRPPLGLREYAPGVPPGTRDLPLDPREFLPGHTHFRPPGSHGPREYFFPGTRLPAPAHSPQEYPPPPATRDAPPPAPQSRSQDSSPALKQSP